MTKKIGIMVPTANPKIEGISINSRLHNLDGKALGFLWNEKPNGDILLNRIREHLLKRYTLARTDWAQAGKTFEETAMIRAVNQLAASTDTIVIAIGD